MTATTVLHIGAMKTGTTYIQQVLSSNRDRLRDHGVLFPGKDWSVQARAVEEVLGLRRDQPWPDPPHAWASLVREVRGFAGQRAVVSMEWLSLATTQQVRSVLSDLGTDVLVVLTVRDAAAVVPALWQTYVHNGAKISWRRFSREFQLAASMPTACRIAPLWEIRHLIRSQDAGFVVPSWTAPLGLDRMRVVTVPGTTSTSRELWDRFATAAGLEDVGCVLPSERANESLGFASAELIRRLNLRLDHMPREDYERTVKAELALRVLAQRRGVEPAIPLDASTREAAARWNERTRRFTTDIALTGSLEDLPVTMASAPPAGRRTFRLADREILAAADAAVEGLRDTIRRKRRRLRRLDPGAAAAFELPAAVLSPEDVDAAITSLAHLVWRVVEIDRVLRDTRSRVAEEGQRSL